MTQTIDISHEEPIVKKFIELWQEKKHYPKNTSLTFGEVVELIIATTDTLYHNDSDGRFFNNLLQNNESILAWDGEEPIDIFFYQAVQNIKACLSRAHTINDDIPS